MTEHKTSNAELFWRSLRDHPGVPYGAAWPLMVLYAVAGRKDFVGFSTFSAAGWVALAVLSLLPWAPILWTAWTGRHEYID